MSRNTGLITFDNPHAGYHLNRHRVTAQPVLSPVAVVAANPMLIVAPPMGMPPQQVGDNVVTNNVYTMGSPVLP